MQARDLLLYNTADKKVNVSVYFQNGTLWLTQKAIAGLFNVKVPAVNKHMKNIVETRALKEEVVSSILEHTANKKRTCLTNVTSHETHYFIKHANLSKLSSAQST